MNTNKFYYFIFKEFFVWGLGIILCIFILISTPLKPSLVPFFILAILGFFIGAVIYAVKLAKSIAGKLVSSRSFQILLPTNKHTVTNFEFNNYKKAWVIIFFENSKLSQLYGDIEIVDEVTNEILSSKILKKAQGIMLKNFKGQKQIVKGREPYQQDKLLILPINANRDRINIRMTLNWNYLNWNSRWEDNIPKDKNLKFQVFFRAK